jgi:Predicted phosphohydrolases
MARILQISDLHIRPKGELCYGQIDTNGMFADAIKQINELTFDMTPS